MYSNVLERIARKKLKINGFKGVYSMDTLPTCLQSCSLPPYRFIVNTHTSNLPGEHWLAVSYEKHGHIYVFDPMGFYYPSYLMKYLSKFHKPIHSNKIPYQSPTNKMCGQYCLRWLKSLDMMQ